jgi:hypothetical protein
MDVMYHWKAPAADLKPGRIGRLSAHKDNLPELAASFPSFVWLLRTPPGKKGQLQLVARVVWADPPAIDDPVKAAAAADECCIHYQMKHPESVWFEGGESEEAVGAVTGWAREYLFESWRGNFRGSLGQHALRGRPLQELEAIARQLDQVSFEDAVAVGN